MWEDGGKGKEMEIQKSVRGWMSGMGKEEKKHVELRDLLWSSDIHPALSPLHRFFLVPW